MLNRYAQSKLNGSVESDSGLPGFGEDLGNLPLGN